MDAATQKVVNRLPIAPSEAGLADFVSQPFAPYSLPEVVAEGLPEPSAVKALETVTDIAAKCAAVYAEIRERQRQQRLETIAHWCLERAAELADDRFSNSQEPDYMADVASVAWEINEITEGRWPPPVVIRIARRRVDEGRQFDESTTTIERRPIELDRVSLDDLERLQVSEIYRDSANPARIVAFKIDFEGWIDSLPDADTYVATSLASGLNVAEVANQMDVAADSIYRIRRSLFQEWWAWFA